MAVAMAEGSCLVRPEDAKDFVKRCLTAVGTVESHARLHSDLLVAADTRGHFSHGLNRIHMYVNDIRNKLCSPNSKPTILKESISTAYVDGNNGLGSVVGKFCVEEAIRKAKQTGIAWVSAKHSNHFGIAGFYTEMVMEEGLMGWSFTNGSPLVAPTRAKRAAMCTNPICVGSYAKDGDRFLLDMATSAVAIGKVEVQARKGAPIPKGWGLNKDGNPTMDPKDVLGGGYLMPLGGDEANSGYKGYGLGFLVDVICGVLSGGTFGPKAKKWMSSDGIADYGHTFIVIDPGCFNPMFKEDLKEFMDTLRSMEPQDPSKPVLIPGDLELQRSAAVVQRGGILYPGNIIQMCNDLAKDLGVEPIVVQ